MDRRERHGTGNASDARGGPEPRLLSALHPKQRPRYVVAPDRLRVPVDPAAPLHREGRGQEP